MDTAADIAASANHVLKIMGYPEQPHADVKHGIGLGVHELMRYVMGDVERGDEKLEQAVRLFREHYEVHLADATRPYPGVVETLRGPLAGFRKAILTNKPQHLTEKILAALKLSNLFDPVVGTGGDLPAKPEPQGLQSIMKFHNAKPEQTILIGDSEVDRLTAKNAGVDFGWVDYGYDSITEMDQIPVYSSAKEWRKLKL